MTNLLKHLVGTHLDYAEISESMNVAIAADCKLSTYFQGLLVEAECLTAVRMEKWSDAMALFSNKSKANVF